MTRDARWSTERRRATVVLFAAASLVACLQSVSDGSLIDANGGVVTAHGARIVVPAGAVDQPTRIEIIETAAPPPAGRVAVGVAVHLRPEGQVFRRPVTVELTLEDDVLEAVVIATAPAGSTAYELLPTQRDGRTVRAEVSHFSIFVPTIEQGGAGPSSPLDSCQADWNAVTWWSPGAGPEQSTPWGNGTYIAEAPWGWMFAVGQGVLSVNRSLEELERYDTQPYAGGVGASWTSVKLISFPGETLLVSSRAAPTTTDFDYVEWRASAMGTLLREPDGGVKPRRVGIAGAHPPAGGLYGPGVGVSRISSWDGVLVAAGNWSGTGASIGFVPRNPALPAWAVPLPSGYVDSTAGVELANGSVLIGLNTALPPATIRTDVFSIARDGGLAPTGWSTTHTHGLDYGTALTAGGPQGATIIQLDAHQVVFYDRGANAPSATVQLPGGQPFSVLRDAWATTPSGQILLLLKQEGSQGSGPDAGGGDYYLLRYPPGDVRPVVRAAAWTRPNIGALRDDSFVFAWLDSSKVFRAARLCLPP